ncbi:MAG: glycosyltransferase family 2 protein [Anaerolineae bacterium]|nr:glycosyltransferase family 2 protein [Anaerolineae bacterium]
MDDGPVISIVAPVYNEVGNLQELHRRISDVLDRSGETWELVFVDDGSTDGSGSAVRELYDSDPGHIRVISFARNFGHQIAVTAGMDYAQGQAVILIDADLQDPPEIILDMIVKWREGYEVIYAVRAKREGESWFKRTTASLFYRLMFSITDISIPLDTGDFRLMDRKVVNAVLSMRERHRFIRGMVSWVGYRQTGIEYTRHERYSGVTKYPLNRMLRFAWDGITGFSYFPLQLATYLGFAIAALSGIAILLVIYLRAFTSAKPLEGQATTLIMVLFLGSVQLLSLGIIGEYLGRIYNEVRGRPLYIVRETYGIDASPEGEQRRSR